MAAQRAIALLSDNMEVGDDVTDEKEVFSSSYASHVCSPHALTPLQMSIVLGYEPLGEFAESISFPVDQVGGRSNISLIPHSSISATQLNYVLCMVLTYPLAGLFRLIPTSLPALRHIIGITLGLAIGLFCFGK